MPWIQLVSTATQETAPIIEDLLLELGACSVTLSDAEDQPVYEPEPGETPIWRHTRVTGLFEADIDTDWLQDQLIQRYRQQTEHDQRYNESQSLAIKVEILEDKDWVREWMDQFDPIACGKRLWICPSWRTPPNPEAVNMMLDPGLAFGTGTHPTTQLCLEWLDAQHLEQKTVIDYGCGSGILAIAALLLGARSAVGIDIDPQALLASRDNAIRNHISDERLSLYLPKAIKQKNWTLQADVVMANILAKPLLELSEELAQRVTAGGKIVLSGIIDHQSDAITNAYNPWFELDPVVSKEGWVRLSGRRKP